MTFAAAVARRILTSNSLSASIKTYSCSNLTLGLGKYVNSIQSSRILHFSTTGHVADIFNVQDEADFKEKVLQNKKPVVVDFHATWCGPCKVLMPRLETIIGATKDGVDLAKVDIDNLPEIAMDYGVGAVPSVLSFKNGEMKDKFVGLQDDDKIQSFVDDLTK